MTAEVADSQQRQLATMVAVYPLADELGEWFAAAGHELYLVGGTVRDTLLHGPGAQDLDFATSARPEETERLLNGWADHVWTTGARFGTISAWRDDTVVEITTFRADRYEPGSRHPEVVYGERIEEDLARRDFTINAMAVQVPEPRFVDPFGGLQDLRDSRLRTPQVPEVSFGDDPLRMVRLARFVGVLDAEPDEPARAAAERMAVELDTVSRERLRDELDKLVVTPAAAKGIDVLCDTGLADRFVPEVSDLRMERDPIHHHKDVYTHSLAVMERCPRDDRILRLAALLHDIGKPPTREFHAGGKVTFHHHEVVGARMARQRLKELRYPGDEVEKICQLIAMHLRFHGYADQPWSDSGVRRYVRDCGSDEQLWRLNQLTRADITTQNKKKARWLERSVDHLEARIEQLKEEEELSRIRPALDGNEIMRYLDLQPGPLVGEAREMLLDARLDQGPMSEEEAYALLDQWAQERGLR
ncbi:CCA tRNA nucleotidyltransferase [Egibacter rhizosphaerae]|uniref:CCA tRNA nucleotidyltransferase n=1 Tax=Egibacter rhizosphaerae TaxID=1670831 RepID=A0A411YFT8_9ACTN|nr:CCA tRNA nucleotidyltransferase [Egibacter rhizosphaerae]QBI20021.1 CCA tRNA nucleotidyltransferase [Egibacter rhizosphaerae]